MYALLLYTLCYILLHNMRLNQKKYSVPWFYGKSWANETVLRLLIGILSMIVYTMWTE